MATKKTAKKAAFKKAAPKKAAAKKSPAKKNPKGARDGAAAVRAYIAKQRPEHREVLDRIDRIIGELVPDVRREIKWNTPFYGRAGKGWFASTTSFKHHAALNFFRGTSLDPVPPVGEAKEMRHVNLADASELDEKLVRSWVKQASAMQGWGKA